MSFFFRWIVREIQNDRWWVLMFVLSLGLGLFGFVGLESFRTGLEDSLRLNARNFLSADLAVSSRRPISESELARVREIVRPRRESHLTEFFSMAAGPGASRLVQVKAIDANYPLYGELRLGSGRVVRRGQSGDLADEPRVWVYPELLTQLRTSIGQKIKIGDLDFTVADTVEDDSTQTFRLGGLAPKVYFSSSHLPGTGLMGFGTTSSDVRLFEVPVENDDELEILAGRLSREFQDPNLQFSTPFDSAEDSARALQRLLDYLGLVSLVGLALALVGIGYLIQLFLGRRIPTLSLLRTLGLRTRPAEVFVLAELAGLGLLSSLLVLPLAALLMPLLGGFLAQFLPIPIQLGVGRTAVVSSLCLATLLPVLIAWPLLLPLRRINLKQVLLDRELWNARIRKRDLASWLPAGLVYFGLSVWVSHSYKIASFFFLGLLGSALVIILLSAAALKAIPDWKGRWTWRQARLRLVRAPLRFSVVILAIAFGTLLLVLLPQVRSSLQDELVSPQAARLPSLFLFDIQDEQIDPMRAYLRETGAEAQHVSPLIRARLLSVNGNPFERTLEKKSFVSREEEAEARFRNRGVNLTFRGELSPSEKLEAGRPFSKDVGETAELSVEIRYAERIGLGLGDRLVFDVQGVEIPGTIVNFRSVKWNSFQPNFFITFQPGHLEEAPKIWLLSVPPLPEEKKDDLQNGLVSRFPNVSIIDISRVIRKVMELTDQMTAALTGMALLSVLVGLFVLFTVLMSEARARIVEWNLYKVLGAGRDEILRLFLIESALVSFLSVALGSLLGTALGYGLMKIVFNAPFSFSPGAFGLAAGAPFLLAFLLSWWLGRRLVRTEAAVLLAESRS